MIKKYYQWFNNYKNYIFWRKEASYVKASFKKSNLKNASKIDEEKRVLILAPHSDDEWIGCSELIKNRQAVVCALNMVGSNDEETRRKRFLEMKLMAEHNRTELVSLSFSGDKVSELSNIINNLKPSFIAVPFFIDWHKEHIQSLKLLEKSIGNYDCDIIMYQVSCPLPLKSITHIYPMAKKEWKAKWKLFRFCYKSQASFPWKRFALVEKAEGGLVNSYAANVFCVMNKKMFFESANYLLNDDDILELRESINNIIKAFSTTNKIFQHTQFII